MNPEWTYQAFSKYASSALTSHSFRALSDMRLLPAARGHELPAL